MTQRTNAFPGLDRDLRFIPQGVEEPLTLTPTQIRRYNEAGHLFPIDIFSPTEIAEKTRQVASGPAAPLPPPSPSPTDT